MEQASSCSLHGLPPQLHTAHMDPSHPLTLSSLPCGLDSAWKTEFMCLKVSTSRTDKSCQSCVFVLPLNHFLIGFVPLSWKFFGSWTITFETEQLLQVLLVPAPEIISHIDICDGNVVLAMDSLDSPKYQPDLPNLIPDLQSRVLILDFVLDLFFFLFERFLNNYQKDSTCDSEIKRLGNHPDPF